MCNVINAYTEAVKKLKALDPEDAALRSGAEYNQDEKNFFLQYFGQKYIIDLEGRVLLTGQEDVSYNDRTIIVQYLVSASGLPARTRWLSFLELPDGMHHYAPFQTDATIPLARRFGKDLPAFEKAALKLGGTRIKLGDSGFKIPALPKLPMAVILWEGDEEFPAQANILYDSVAPTHLTTAALWVLGVELAHKMICSG